MSTTSCQICGTESQTRTMEMACGPGKRRTLSVCPGCLSQRDTRQWNTDGGEGRRLLDALTSREHEHPQGRYTYLLDPDDAVHLVRLQHDWMDQHAASA